MLQAGLDSDLAETQEGTFRCDKCQHHECSHLDVLRAWVRLSAGGHSQKRRTENDVGRLSLILSVHLSWYLIVEEAAELQTVRI